MDEEVRALARRILDACAAQRITWAEMMTLFRVCGIAEIPLHHLL